MLDDGVHDEGKVSMPQHAHHSLQVDAAHEPSSHRVCLNKSNNSNNSNNNSNNNTIAKAKAGQDEEEGRAQKKREKVNSLPAFVNS